MVTRRRHISCTRHALLLMLCVGLFACDRGDDEQAQAPFTAKTPIAEEPVSGFRVPTTFAYRCEDGTEFLARNEPDAKHMLLHIDGQTHYLEPQQSFPGAHYQDDSVHLISRGNVASLERNGLPTLTCMVDRHRSRLEDARYRNVQVWAIGSTPDWRLEIASTHILFETTHGTEVHVFTLEQVDVRSGGDSYHYTGSAEEQNIVITATSAHCHDTVSSRDYDHTIRVEIGERIFNGCGLILGSE